MFHKLLILGATLLGLANAQLPCDSQVSDCNPITNENFANINSKSLTYPSPTSTILGGIVYDTVYHWVPESGHDLLHSFVFYTASGTLGTCSDSLVWNNGVSVNFVQESRGGLTVCYAPISEQFDRDDLSNPTDVYIMLKGAFTIGDSFFIDRDYSVPIVPAEDAIFYLYELDTTGLTVDSSGTVITLDVNNLTYSSQDFDGIGSCDDMETALASIDVSGCTLNLNSGASDPNNGIFVYNFPKTQYESCSDSVNGIGNLVTYSSTITLRTDESPCFYFRPGDHQQVINIEFDGSGIGGSVSLNATDISVQVLEYGIERCLPISSYILPQHRAVFTVNVTTGGDTNPTISSSPYLDTTGNLLNLDSTTCATHESGSGVECTFVLSSTDCRPSLVNDDGDCIVDRFTENDIYDLEFTIGSDTVEVAGTTSETAFKTGLENARFAGSECTAPANTVIENVTDSYTGTVEVRNLPNPNWGVETDVKFYDEVILEMTIDAGSLTATELQIQSVTVTLEDPNDPGVTIAQRVFHKGDKVALEEFQFSPYYDDAHFCSWHDPDNTCPVFYEVGSDRVNAFFTSDIQPRLADVCQTSGDSAITDYFSFNPTNWFASLAVPEIAVTFDVLATIEYCDGRSNRRMLQGGSSVTTVNYVQYDTARNLQTILFTGGTTAPSASPTAPPTDPPTTAAPTTKPTEDELNVALVVGGSVGGVCVCLFFIFIALRKKKKRTGSRYDSI